MTWVHTTSLKTNAKSTKRKTRNTITITATYPLNGKGMRRPRENEMMSGHRRSGRRFYHLRHYHWVFICRPALTPTPMTRLAPSLARSKSRQVKTQKATECRGDDDEDDDETDDDDWPPPSNPRPSGQTENIWAEEAEWWEEKAIRSLGGKYCRSLTFSIQVFLLYFFTL